MSLYRITFPGLEAVIGCRMGNRSKIPLQLPKKQSTRKLSYQQENICVMNENSTLIIDKGKHLEKKVKWI